jgi:ribosomal protein L13
LDQVPEDREVVVLHAGREFAGRYGTPTADELLAKLEADYKPTVASETHMLREGDFARLRKEAAVGERDSQ